MTLSTDVMLFSVSADWRMAHWNSPVSVIADDITRPAALPVIAKRAVYQLETQQ